MGDAPAGSDEGVELALLAVESRPGYHSVMLPHNLGTHVVPGPRGINKVGVPPDVDFVMGLEGPEFLQCPERGASKSAVG